MHKFLIVGSVFMEPNLSDIEMKRICMQIEWNVRAGSLRNVESARISIPGTVKYDESKQW